jgi:ATP-dependent DNA helicase RecG
VAENVLQGNNRPLERQLISLRCLSEEGLPTYGAVLLFGKDALRWIPGAYVQFVRFDGKAITDPIKNQKRLSGPLYEILPLLEELVNINISVPTDLTSAVEIQVPDYPVQALRQLLRNAVMHRSYESTNAPVRVNWFSDRVEILSPGGLYGQVNKENFGKGVTDYRNPLVAEGMRVLGYVQRFGVGIPLVLSALHENGNPPPEFSFETGVAVIVRRRG